MATVMLGGGLHQLQWAVYSHFPNISFVSIFDSKNLRNVPPSILLQKKNLVNPNCMWVVRGLQWMAINFGSALHPTYFLTLPPLLTLLLYLSNSVFLFLCLFFLLFLYFSNFVSSYNITFSSIFINLLFSNSASSFNLFRYFSNSDFFNLCFLFLTVPLSFEL